MKLKRRVKLHNIPAMGLYRDRAFPEEKDGRNDQDGSLLRGFLFLVLVQIQGKGCRGNLGFTAS